MSLLEQINQDLKQAMRDRAELKLSVLRMLTSAIKNKEISLRSNEPVEISDQLVKEVLASEVKKRQDAIESYQAAGRAELAEKESAEMAVLKNYLPEQLGEAEVEKIIRQLITGSGSKEFGQVMKQAMSELKGKADGKLVGELVKKVLME